MLKENVDLKCIDERYCILRKGSAWSMVIDMGFECGMLIIRFGFEMSMKGIPWVWNVDV